MSEGHNVKINASFDSLIELINARKSGDRGTISTAVTNAREGRQVIAELVKNGSVPSDTLRHFDIGMLIVISPQSLSYAQAADMIDSQRDSGLEGGAAKGIRGLG